jgi:(p)ppGpp synthase/HD superfamily hydrolase
MTLITRAKVFATSAHKNQTRRYTGEPYIVHPQRVAELVQTVTRDDAVIAAAWLHDVVEDTDITLGEINDKFGYEVALLVKAVTNVAVRGNRAERKAQELQRLTVADPNAKTIKLADMIDNIPSIVQYDPNFARLYLVEKLELLRVLSEGGLVLFDQAFDCICTGFKGLQL